MNLAILIGHFPPGAFGGAELQAEAWARRLAARHRVTVVTRRVPHGLPPSERRDGYVLGLDRGPRSQDDPPQIGLLAEAGKAGDWIAAMARRRVQARPEQAAVLYVDGHVRAYQGTRKIAKTHVPRRRSPPRPPWKPGGRCGRDPLLVVMAEPGASLAAELRRLIPELRALVGDGRPVLVGSTAAAGPRPCSPTCTRPDSTP